MIDATRDIGRPPPHRPFRGHLTLARARHPRNLAGLAAAAVSERWEVDELDARPQRPQIGWGPLPRGGPGGRSAPPAEVMLLAGFRLGTPDEVVEPAWLAVDGEVVTAVGRGEPAGTPDIDLAGALVVPGFVDLHCHGGGGASFGEGGVGADRAVAFHLRHGTTSTLASLVSAAPEVLTSQVAALAEMTRTGLIEGIHLEGPFLAVALCGAHDPAVLRDPTGAEVDHLIAAAGGTLRMVTLAPERTGALEAIARLSGVGVLAAVGHTEATYEQTLAAIDAGARVATHLGNAMAPFHHRRPGPLLALLDDDRVVCELIDDGVHLHPAFIAHVRRRVGDQRVALITDAIAAAGAGAGDYRLGGVVVRVAHGEARVAVSGVLAGSTLTSDRAFRNAVVEAGFSIPAAVRATATTPATLLGRRDLGRLAPGCRADLVVLDADAGWQVRAVLRRGVWVTPPVGV